MFYFCGIFQFASLETGFSQENYIKEMMMKSGTRFLNIYMNTGENTRISKYDEQGCFCVSQQPTFYRYENMISAKNDIVAVIDGRIDNKQINKNPADEILKEVLASDITALKQFIGDFAVVIMNKRDQKMYLYRSPFGVRPLYFFWKQGHHRAAWGSTLEQLLQLPEISKIVTSKYIAEYLYTFTNANIRSTPYEDVYRVLPGECIELHRNTWRTLFVKEPVLKDMGSYSEKEMIEQFREIMYESVCARIRRAPAKIQLSLSGGLDSSTLACITSHVIKKEQFSNQLVFNHFLHDKQGNELEFAQAVSEKTGGELNVYPSMETQGFLEYLNLARDIPVHEPSDIVLGKMDVNGPDAFDFTSVNMTGIGGDQVLIGNNLYLTDLISKGRLISAVKLIRQFATKKNQSFILTFYNVLRPLFNYPSMLTQDSLAVHYQLLTEEFYHGWMIGKNTGHQMVEKLKKYPFEVRYEYEKIIIGDQWLGTDGFNWLVDMHPFLDWRVFEFCLSLPWTLKRTHEIDKLILRRAFEDLLPQAVLNRREKSSHYGTVTKGVRMKSGKINEILEQSRLIKYGIVHKRKYEELLGYLEYGTLQDPVGLLRVLSLDIWLISKGYEVC